MCDAGDDAASRARAGDDGLEPAAFSGGAVACVEAQIRLAAPGVRPVAGEASLGKQRAYVALEIDLGAGGRSRQRRQAEEYQRNGTKGKSCPLGVAWFRKSAPGQKSASWSNLAYIPIADKERTARRTSRLHPEKR
jgi:hypothetical protein